MKRAKASAANAINAAGANRANAQARAAMMKFSPKRMKMPDLARRIQKLMDRMRDANQSQNTYKVSYYTFQRANRRNPDDYNLRGRALATHYHPDIHIYADTSGSISQENYEGMMKACIAMASKLNVNLYFNSFSDHMSQETLLKTKDAQFEKTPKVTGGTNFEQIWHYINSSPKRKARLSIIITDFEWAPRRNFVDHPKNLYYAPCDKMNYSSITRAAEDFAKSMLFLEPNIRGRILMD